MRQAATLYIEKAEKAGLIWEETLSGITSLTHRWKWEYMDYLEAIRFKDVDSVTLQEAKEAILTYEEFAEIKELEVKEKEPEQIVDDSNEFVNENTVDTVIIEQPVIEADIVAESVDFTKRAGSNLSAFSYFTTKKGYFTTLESDIDCFFPI